jgi:NADH dehydrogenase
VRTGTAVTRISANAVEAGDEAIEAGAVVWAAGVRASGAAAWLGADADRAGRVQVGPDLRAPGHPDIFVIGDTAAVLQDSRPVPGIAPAAKQMGAYVANVIKARLAGADAPGPFRYKHAGDLATIGRRAAIVKLPGLELTGFAAWLFWSLAHVYFLITLRNRIAVAFTWAWDYVTFGRRARLITHMMDAGD